jgi:hypothetical protein
MPAVATSSWQLAVPWDFENMLMAVSSPGWLHLTIIPPHESAALVAIPADLLQQLYHRVNPTVTPHPQSSCNRRRSHRQHRLGEG